MRALIVSYRILGDEDDDDDDDASRSGVSSTRARARVYLSLAPFALLQRNAHRGSTTVQRPDFCV